jgi:hypothetical protein
MYYSIMVAFLLANGVGEATAPWDKPWSATQDIDPHSSAQGVIVMPVGHIHIVITRSGANPAVIPLETCVAMTMARVPVGGQIARKDGRCEISFVVQTQPTPYIVGLRNDDYVDHTYTFSYSK